MDHRSTWANSGRGPTEKSRGPTCKGGDLSVMGRRIQKTQKKQKRVEKGKERRVTVILVLIFQMGLFLKWLNWFVPHPSSSFSSVLISSTHNLRCPPGPRQMSSSKWCGWQGVLGRGEDYRKPISVKKGEPALRFSWLWPIFLPEGAGIPSFSCSANKTVPQLGNSL